MNLKSFGFPFWAQSALNPDFLFGFFKFFQVPSLFRSPISWKLGPELTAIINRRNLKSNLSLTCACEKLWRNIETIGLNLTAAEIHETL